MSAQPASIDIPERLAYKVKRVLLGKPLVTASMHDEKLSKTLALGVLSSDCISSAAYGTEEMLIALVVVFGLTGFQILMPLTAIVLGVLVLMTLSYREVVSVYTKSGGSYVVARENFGQRVALVAAVALMIDYIVTVAVQTAAGVAAVTSAVPALNHKQTVLAMTVVVVLLLAYGNLRGLREAGRTFAFPTYFFVAMGGLVVIVGVLREIFGDLPHLATNLPGQYAVVDKHHAILTGAAFFVLLRAFANGGSSLTGLEAISNGVSAFKRPEGVNARRTLSTMSIMLGSLVLGISFLAWQTHATPFKSGSPTVISQVTQAAFGHAWYGSVGHILVQTATALILFTGANTPFTGFPYLASFVAEDSFLPRQLMVRGHRLAFSNGILILTAAALALLVAVGTNVNALVPFYAIGVFTGFTMAGLGMARYHQTHREQGWRRRHAINFSGGVVSALVVVIFAVVKFTEGAWLVVILFPLGWLLLVRLNSNYRREARSLELVTAASQQGQVEMHYPRHVVLVMVDRLDLAVLRALRYAGSLRPTQLRAVHLMIDSDEAHALERSWVERKLGERVPLEIVECPDRRLVRTIAEYSLGVVLAERAEVTILLPRRTFRRVSQRLLHDRTADRIAAAVSRLPHVSATIVPFDTTLLPEVEQLLEDRRAQAAQGRALTDPMARISAADDDYDDIEPPVHVPAGNGLTPIGSVAWRQRVTIEGRVKIVQVGTSAGKALEAQVFDDTGGVRLLFFGRTYIPGIEPGAVVRASGAVGEYKGHLALANPRYELVADFNGAKPVAG